MSIKDFMKEDKNAEVLTFNLTILNLLSQGKNPAKISKELNISMPRISYHLRKMQDDGIIEKKGYGTWEVKQVKTSVSNTLTKSTPKEIRGHAFIWVIKIPKEMKGLREKALEKGKAISKGQVRLIIKDHKVWVGKENIIIFENKSFYAKDSIESRKYAAITLIEVLRALERELDTKLSPYVFKPCREHYGMIKNDLAIQCNRNKEKIAIHDNLEGEWLWIDDSESLGELETGGIKAVVRSKQVQNWWNDQKKHNFELNASKTLEMINGLTTSQQTMINTMNDYAIHIKAHTESIKALSKAIPQLTSMLKNVREENKQLKQKRLNDF